MEDLTVRKWQKISSAVNYKCQITGLHVKKCVVTRNQTALLSGVSAFISFLYSSKVFCHSLSHFQCKTVRHMSDQHPKLCRSGHTNAIPYVTQYEVCSMRKAALLLEVSSRDTLASDNIYCEEWRVQGRGSNTIPYCVWTQDAVTVSAGWTMKRMLTKFWCARTCV